MIISYVVFVKQMTAYEMRISDWSSDVCSSDLVVILPVALTALGLGAVAETLIALMRWPFLAVAVYLALIVLYRFGPSRTEPQWKWVSWGAILATEIGRASCRERVWQYV